MDPQKSSENSSPPMFVHKEQLYIRFEEIAWEDLGGGVRRKIMAYGDQLMAVYLEFKKGAVGALHAHPHVQAAFVRSGSVQVRIGEEYRVLGAGDFYYIPSGVEHGSLALEDSVVIDIFSPMRQDFLPKS
jgi:quercetin dioxygenase-like cupin family protein